ncbi:MAG: DinB family protein [Candidatus Hydrogenedentes bacterium]|nr:DinB family protein [Candidatus Hydrogenedentota bacterium]
MNAVNTLLEEFKRSLPATKAHLSRLPEDKLDWRPAEKSLTLGQLALHIAESPGGTSSLALTDSFDISGGPSFRQPESVAEILETFEASCAEARDNLDKAAGLPLGGIIAFTLEGAPVFEMSRGDILRDIFLNHTYHHRGQLGVYLRLLGVPVPSTYGPSADESMMPTPEGQAV